MRTGLQATLLVVFLVSRSSSLLAEEAKLKSVVTSIVQGQEFLGCWKADGDKPLLFRCEPTRITLFDPEDEKVQLFRAKYDSGRVLINVMGTWITLPVTRKDQTLLFSGKTLHKMDNVPKEVIVEPFCLGTTRQVPAEDLKFIKAELLKRFQEDQDVRSTGSGGAENWNKIDSDRMHKIDASNTKYLLSIVSTFGWCDTGRFGEDTSLHAWGILQHSGHIPLMLAVLPEIRKRLRANQTIPSGGVNTHESLASLNEAETYAMLYDRLQVMLGNKQRYGSQMGRNEKGEILILALEDRKKVDEFRAEIGLSPILPGLEKSKAQNSQQAIHIEEE